MATFTADHARKLDEIHAKVIALSARCPMHASRVDAIELDLYGRPGNGQSSGFKARLQVVEATVEDHDEAISRGRRFAWKLAVGLAIGASGPLLTWLLIR